MNPVPVDSVANREYARALATIRGWRTFFVLFAVLGPLVHLLAWTAVRFGDVLREPSPPAAPATTTPPAGETNATNGVDEPVGAAQTPPVVPAEPVAADSRFGDPETWRALIRVLLPLAEFVGRCAVVGLVITLLLGVLVVLNGRMIGVSEIIRGMFMAVIAALLFVPWERLTLQETQIPGVFTTPAKIESVVAPDPIASAAQDPVKVGGVELGDRATWDTVVDVIRHAALPFIAIVIVLIAGSRFGRGYRAAVSRGGPDVAVKVV